MPEVAKKLSPAKQYAAWLKAAKDADKAATKAAKASGREVGFGKIGDGTLVKWIIENKAFLLQLALLFAK